LARCAINLQKSLQTAGRRWAVRAVFARVDTCAADSQPRPRTCIRLRDESEADARQKKASSWVVPEPHRQGIEFDYCCCHAVFALL